MDAGRIHRTRSIVPGGAPAASGRRLHRRRRSRRARLRWADVRADHDLVGLVPAHGFAVDPDLTDPTAAVVGLFAELAPVTATTRCRSVYDRPCRPRPSGQRSTMSGSVGEACSPTRPPRPTATDDRCRHSDRHLRRSRFDRSLEPDRVSTTALLRRSTPIRYRGHLHKPATYTSGCSTMARSTSLPVGAAGDVGLLTLELVSPAPRLCADGRPYIGPTASPSIRARRGHRSGPRGSGVGLGRTSPGTRRSRSTSIRPTRCHDRSGSLGASRAWATASGARSDTFNAAVARAR